MRRIQIHIDEALDEALAAEAGRTGISKAALIREYIAERLEPLPPPHQDPLAELVGDLDIAPGAVDGVVYRR